MSNKDDSFTNLGGIVLQAIVAKEVIDETARVFLKERRSWQKSLAIEIVGFAAALGVVSFSQRLKDSDQSTRLER